MSIRRTTKKEIRRVKSLRRLSGLSNAPRGLYFVAVNGKAYVCDTLGFKGAEEIANFNKKLKKELGAQTKLV